MFKRIWKMVEKRREVGGADHLAGMHWMAGHVFVIDFFLWFMAQHGWTLQRSRRPVAFHDLAGTLKASRDADMEAFAAVKPTPPAAEPARE